MAVINETSPGAKPDAQILAAWGRRSVAYATYNALPTDDQPDHDQKAEQAQLAIVDSAEDFVLQEIATTPLGVEIQLWTALFHMDVASQRIDEQALNVMDLDLLLAKEANFDWPDRFILAALKSLRSMRVGGAA